MCKIIDDFLELVIKLSLIVLIVGFLLSCCLVYYSYKHNNLTLKEGCTCQKE